MVCNGFPMVFNGFQWFLMVFYGEIGERMVCNVFSMERKVGRLRMALSHNRGWICRCLLAKQTEGTLCFIRI